MSLTPADASYTLLIDSQLPIDTILLQSTQQIDILSITEGSAKKNLIGKETLLATLKVD